MGLVYLCFDDKSLIIDRMKRKKRKKREFQSRQRQRQVQMLIQVDKNLACHTHSTQYAAASTRSRTIALICATACIFILKPCGHVLKAYLNDRRTTFAPFQSFSTAHSRQRSNTCVRDDSVRERRRTPVCAIAVCFAR